MNKVCQNKIGVRVFRYHGRTQIDMPAHSDAKSNWEPSAKKFQINLCQGFLSDSSFLKTLGTIGNCQRPVFSLGVSQHMHNITNLSSIGRQSCKITMKEKLPLSQEVVCFQIFETWNLILMSQNQIREQNFFFESCLTSEGAVSHNVIFYPPLPITR